jgi:hypothetical protein
MLFSFQRPSALASALQGGPGETKASRIERPTSEPHWAAIGSRRLLISEPTLLPVPLEATSEYSAVSRTKTATGRLKQA